MPNFMLPVWDGDLETEWVGQGEARWLRSRICGRLQSEVSGRGLPVSGVTVHIYTEGLEWAYAPSVGAPDILRDGIILRIIHVAARETLLQEDSESSTPGRYLDNPGGHPTLDQVREKMRTATAIRISYEAEEATTDAVLAAAWSHPDIQVVRDPNDPNVYAFTNTGDAFVILTGLGAIRPGQTYRHLRSSSSAAAEIQAAEDERFIRILAEEVEKDAKKREGYPTLWEHLLGS